MTTFGQGQLSRIRYLLIDVLYFALISKKTFNELRAIASMFSSEDEIPYPDTRDCDYQGK